MTVAAEGGMPLASGCCKPGDGIACIGPVDDQVSLFEEPSIPIAHAFAIVANRKNLQLTLLAFLP